MEYKLDNYRTWFVILNIGMFVSLHSCGFYSFSGSLAPHLNTISIPLFQDRTAEFGIKEELTDALIDEFTQDNTLSIADPANADLHLEGTLESVNDRASDYDQQERVQDVRVYLTVNIKCEVMTKRTVLWEERLTQWGDYDPSLGPDARQEGITEAITKLTSDILNKTVAGW